MSPARCIAAVLALTFLLVAPRAVAATDTISTVAGSGAAGFHGDGGPAAAARLFTPTSVEVLVDGGYLIADQGNSRVRRVAPDGTITTLAGSGSSGFAGDGGPATAAKFNAINGMAELTDGSIVVADSNNNRVRRIAPNGTISTVAGNGAANFSGDGGPATAAGVNFPVDVAALPDGGFLIADNDNHRIRRVAPGGTITTVAGTGAAGGAGDGGPATSAQLAGPSGVAVVEDGFLIAEQDGHRVRHVDAGGRITRVAGTGAPGAGGDAGPATAAQLNQPVGLAATAGGGFVVGDSMNNRVRAVTPGGTITTLAGTGLAGFSGDGGRATDARLNRPFGVATTSEGDVLIADALNHRVRLVDAGDPATPSPPPSGDGGGGGTAPPPPAGPADEPPPTVTALRTSVAELVARRPAMLTPEINGSATQIDYDVTGDGRFDASCPGDQSSLIFRPAAGAARAAQVKSLRSVGVRAHGAGGIGALLTRPMPVVAAPPIAAVPPRVDAKIGNLVAKKPVFLCTDAGGIFVTPLGSLERLRDPSLQKCFDATYVAGALRVRGCFDPITRREDIPEAERPAVDRLVGMLFARGVVDPVLAATDGMVARGSVLVNGLVVQPAAGARIVVHKQLESLISSNAAITAGGIKLDHRPDFRMLTRDVAGRIPLGSFRRLPGGRSILGLFGIDGDVGIELVRGDGLDAHAEVTANLVLPAWLGSPRLATKVRLQPDGSFALDSMRIGPANLSLGSVGINRLLIEYAGDRWRGELKLCVTSTACIDASRPRGGVEIGPGDGFSVRADLPFPPPGLPLFKGVYLTSINAGLAEPPLRFFGGASITAAGIFEIDGRLVFAFPSAAAPYRLERDVFGGSFSDAQYARSYERFTLAAAADAFLRVPAVGRIRLGGGHLLYVHPGYVAYGGGVNADFLGVIRIIGTTSGEFNAENGRFNLHGNAQSCIARIPILDNLCWGSVVNISSVGVGGCVSVGPVSVGGGVRWPDDVMLWLFDGCRWSPFAERNVFGARAAQGGAPQVIRTQRGDPSQAIELRGATGAPRVRVTTADGKSLVSTDGPGLAHTDGIRILRSEHLKLTVIGIVDPAPGEHAIALLPGSPAVDRVRGAEDQPPARIRARLRRRGDRRILTYDIARRDAQRVTFIESGPDGSRELGTTTGGRGRIAFTPAPGGGTRTVEAQFELAGLGAERRTVATFRPPSARLPRPHGVRVRRAGTALRVRWRGVPGAARYEVVARLRIGGERRLHTRRPRSTIRRVPRWSAGTVRVRALASLRSGEPRSARFRADRRRPRTRIRALPAARR